MKTKSITLSKEFKKGLPNYSNSTVGIVMNFEIEEGEEFNWNGAWDIINRELQNQAGDNDASWLKTEELKDNYKYTIKIPKNGGVNQNG